jgi:tRNA G18 (ribose-2'-O)-methylase SpoU
VEIPVACIDDPRLDDYRNIPDPDLLRSRGIFVAEGRHVVRRLLISRFRTRSILVTAAAYDAIRDVVEHAADVPVFVVSQDAMNAITGFNIHRGCLAVGERPPAARWQDVVHAASTVVVLERVSNADNVGGIFRNAAAFGAGAVLLGPACADPLYRKAIRTSMGAALHVPFAALPGWPGDLEHLKRDGFTVIALTPGSGARPLTQLDGVVPPVRAAILVGHEGDGLSSEALAAAHVRVRIPMAGAVDSLNVATATAIALYELSRD